MLYSKNLLLQVLNNMYASQFYLYQLSFLCTVSHFTNISALSIHIDGTNTSSSRASLQQVSTFVTYTISILLEPYHYDDSFVAWKHLNASLTDAVDEGLFTVFLLSISGDQMQSNVFSNSIEVYPLSIVTVSPSFQTNSSRVSSIGSSPSGQLQFLWSYILAAVIFVATILVCFFCWQRKSLSLLNTKLGSLARFCSAHPPAEFAPTEKDYIEWGLPNAVTSKASPLLQGHLDSDNGDDKIGYIFNSKKIEMSRPEDFIVV